MAHRAHRRSARRGDAPKEVKLWEKYFGSFRLLAVCDKSALSTNYFKHRRVLGPSGMVITCAVKEREDLHQKMEELWESR